MAQIFDISNGEVVLTPEGLSIPSFKRIWDRDKSKDKNRALNEIRYVVFMKDPVRSPYKDIEATRKDVMVKEDIFGDVEWAPDSFVKEAMADYEELRISTTLRLLRSAKIATEKLANYFEDVDFSLVDPSTGKPVYSARELSSNLGSVGSIIKSLITLEDAAKREMLENSHIKGGSEISYFEDPDNY